MPRYIDIPNFDQHFESETLVFQNSADFPPEMIEMNNEFRQLQLLLEDLKNRPGVQKQNVLRQIMILKDKMIAYYPIRANESYGTQIVNWLAYMQTILMRQLGLKSTNFLVELPSDDYNKPVKRMRG